MRPFLLALAGISASIGPSVLRAQVRQPTRPSLTAFRSEREVARYLDRLSKERERLSPSSCKGAGTTARRIKVQREQTLEPSGQRGAVLQGRVTGTTHQALPGVLVTITPLGLQATTGANGGFALRIPADSLATTRTLSIVARGIGYKKREHRIRIRRAEVHDVTGATASSTARTPRKPAC